ncbi:MAG: MFS transporter [Afipia sp.]|nr:MFS transporter [Afipia sp.]
MSRTERQGLNARSVDAADTYDLSDETAQEISHLATEVIDVVDAPPIVPAPSLDKAEVRTVLLSLMLTMFLTALDQTIVATALPTIGRQFNDVNNLSWVITAYLLASTAVSPVYGTLSDIYGRRAMIVISMTLFLLGSVACALAPNMLTLIFARALQGIGGGGILPLVQIVISDVVTPRERGQYQAYFSSVWVSAGIGGPILGGLIAEHLHWSVIFWINLPLGILSLALLLPRMKNIPVFHRRRKLDWIGGVLLMAAAVVFLLVLTWGGNRFAWASPTILAMVGSAVALAAAFVWHARRTEEPFLPIPLLGGTVVPYAMIAGGCAMGAMIGLTVHMPLYYEVVYGLSAAEAGAALIPLVAVSVLGAWAAGRAMVRMAHYKRATIFGASMSAVAAFVLATATPLSLVPMLALLSVFAVGLGTVFPLSVVSIQNAVARAQVGTATGAMNFFRALMASFSVAVFTAILLAVLGRNISIGVEQHAGTKHAISAADMVSAFRYVFATAGLMLASAAALYTIMEERPLAGPAKIPAAEPAE